MSEVSAYEAKTHLSQLLERARQGERIVITRHGRPVARLVPVAVTEEGRVERAITALKSLRRGASLDGLAWQELRDAGRR